MANIALFYLHGKSFAVHAVHFQQVAFLDGNRISDSREYDIAHFKGIHFGIFIYHIILTHFHFPTRPFLS